MAVAMPNRIYIIDHDHARRAALANASMSIGVHAEPCQGVEEFLQSPWSVGIVFCSAHEGLGTLERLRASEWRRNQSFSIIAYSPSPRPEEIVGAMLLGALDYLEWPINPQRLLDSLKMNKQQLEIEKLRLRKLEAAQLISRLTSREQEVLKKIIKGYSSKEIAKEFVLSHRTVEAHRGNIIEKLGLRSIVDAIRIGVYAGLDD